MVLSALVVVAAVGSAAVGGVFFAFSAFVMPGLRRLPPHEGIAAMQAVNTTAVRPPLMALLMGTAALSLGLGARGVAIWGDAEAALLVTGAVTYVVGTVVLTGVFHVPRNDALAALDARAPGSDDAWAAYVREWTVANHLRAVAGLAASAAYVCSLL